MVYCGSQQIPAVQCSILQVITDNRGLALWCGVFRVPSWSGTHLWWAGHTCGEQEVCTWCNRRCCAPSAVCTYPVPVPQGRRPLPFLCLHDCCYLCKGNFQWCLLCPLGYRLLRISRALVTRWDAFVPCFCTALVSVAVLSLFCVMNWLKSTTERLASDSRNRVLFDYCPIPACPLGNGAS